MRRYAAFLRGMNVGGHRLGNAELCSHLVDLGFENVSAFLASGNVVFDASGRVTHIAARIEKGLREKLGYEVPAFLRTPDEVRSIATRGVFAEMAAGSAGKLLVALLLAAPKPTARQRVLRLDSNADRLEIDGRELYWLPRGKLTESKLDLALIEAELGPMTVRTRRTLERLARRYFEV